MLWILWKLSCGESSFHYFSLVSVISVIIRNYLGWTWIAKSVSYVVFHSQFRPFIFIWVTVSLREDLGISYTGSFPPGSAHSFQWSQDPWLNFVHSPGQNTADFPPSVLTTLLVWLIKGVGPKLKTINTGTHFIKLPSSKCILHATWSTAVHSLVPHGAVF